MLNRSIGLSMLFVLSLVVTACGGATADVKKVGLVTDVGTLEDKSFNEASWVGAQAGAQALGGTANNIVTKKTADYAANIKTFVDQGYGVIVTVGFAMGDATTIAAKTYPKVKFIGVDQGVCVDETGKSDPTFACKGDPKTLLPNYQGLVFKEEQVGYLAGYAAGLAAKADGATTVSSVGGQKQPPVDRYIAGYEAGAKAAFPSVKTVNGYSQDFSVESKCKELALNQIAAGSDVVFQVAGGCGLGALDAAKTKSVWGIGVDADQGFLGPHILTSALKGVDEAVFLSIKDAKEGHFKGGQDAVYGLEQKGVGLGKFSPKAPKGIEAKVKQIEQQIIDGKIANIPTTVK